MSLRDTTVFGYTAIILLSLGVSVRVGLFTARRSEVPGARSFSMVVFLEAAWTFAFFWEMFSASLQAKIFWDNLQWLLSLFIPLGILAFAFDYTEIKLPRARLVWSLLAAIPSLATLLVYTNAWHGLAIQSIRLVETGPFSEYLYDYGMALLISIGYVYLLSVIALGLLIDLVIRKRSAYRTQTLIVLVGFIVPILGSVVSLSGVRIWQFRDASPITFAIANGLIAFGLFRYRIFNIIPLARELVVDFMEDGVIVLDVQERLVDINQAARALIGRPKANLIGLPAWAFSIDWLQPADLPAGKDSIHKEVTIQNQAGFRTIDLRISRITAYAGTLAGYLIILRDITSSKQADQVQRIAYEEMEAQVAERTAELSNTVRRMEEEFAQRKSMQEALRAKSENLDAVSRLAIQLAVASAVEEVVPLVTEYINEVTGASGSTFSMYDPQAKVLRVKYVAIHNRLMKKVTGYLPELLNLSMPVSLVEKERMISSVVACHTSIADVTFGAMPGDLINRLQKILRIGEMVSITLHLDGDLFGCIMIFLPEGVPLPAMDMLEAFSHVVSVTLRRNRAEEALRASELRFRTLLENANDIISVVDRQGNQLFTYYANNQNRVLGYPEDIGIEKNLLEFIHPDDRAKAREILARIVERPGSHELFELRYRHMDGNWVTLETYARNMLDNPLIGGIISTSRDVTARKQAEEEQRRLNRTLKMISECNLSLVRMDDEPILLQAICQVIVETGGYAFAYIDQLLDGPDRRLVPTVYHAVGGFPLSQEDSDRVIEVFLSGESDQQEEMLKEREMMESDLIEALSMGKPFVLNDMHNFPYPAHRKNGLRLGLMSIVVLPLIYGDEVYGSLHIHGSEINAYDEKEVDLLTEMAHDVSFGIHARRMRASRDRAEREARKANTELHESYESTLEGWSRALELRERETAGHSQRVVDMTLALARRMGFSGEDCVHIRRGALLHDIGKMGIPDNILLKPSSLTLEDWEIMRRHPAFARDLLTGIPYLEQALVIPYHHHERWNGSGYPDGLKGEEIPLPARIFAVIDVWDALGWDRPYRKAWPDADVLQYLTDNAGILFDPQVVGEFLRMLSGSQP